MYRRSLNRPIENSLDRIVSTLCTTAFCTQIRKAIFTLFVLDVDTPTAFTLLTASFLDFYCLLILQSAAFCKKMTAFLPSGNFVFNLIRQYTLIKCDSDISHAVLTTRYEELSLLVSAQYVLSKMYQ